LTARGRTHGCVPTAINLLPCANKRTIVGRGDLTPPPRLRSRRGHLRAGRMSGPYGDVASVPPHQIRVCRGRPPGRPADEQCTVTNNAGAVIDRPRAHTRVRPYGDVICTDHDFIVLPAIPQGTNRSGISPLRFPRPHSGNAMAQKLFR